MRCESAESRREEWGTPPHSPLTLSPAPAPELAPFRAGSGCCERERGSGPSHAESRSRSRSRSRTRTIPSGFGLLRA
jgi:hypothetical protein